MPKLQTIALFSNRELKAHPKAYRFKGPPEQGKKYDKATLRRGLYRLALRAETLAITEQCKRVAVAKKAKSKKTQTMLMKAADHYAMTVVRPLTENRVALGRKV